MRKLHPLCNITLSESLEAVATLASKHSLSNSAVEDILKFIKLHLPKPTQYPSSYYKYRKQLGNTKEFYELRFYCDSCKILLTENHSCPTCNSEYDKLSIRKDGNFFIEFNMERQLRCILDSQDVQRELTDFFIALWTPRYVSVFKVVSPICKVSNAPQISLCHLTRMG